MATPGLANEERQLSQVDQAIADLNTCLGSLPEPSLDVFYLMDGSGSLANDGNRAGADPEGIRFAAVEESVAPLAELAGAGVLVNVAAATFGDGATTVFPWTQVEGGDPEGLAQDLSSELERSFNRENTNWVAGLELAEEELASQRDLGPRCQSLIWITDGGIFLENNADTNAEGIEVLCGVTPTEFNAAKALGSMFRLRNAQVVVLGFLLNDPNTDSESRVSYFTPVVEGAAQVDASYFGGDSGQFACGQIVQGAAGAAIPAKDPSALADALWAVSICITNRCVSGDGFNEPLEQDSDGNWIVPVTSGIATVLVRPRADSVKIFNPDGKDVCSAGTDCTVVDGSLRISVLGEAGIWRIANGGDASPVVRFLTEIQLEPNVSADLVAGEDSGVTVTVSQAGEPFRSDLYDDVDLRWSFESDTGESTSGSISSAGALDGFAPEAGGRLVISLKAFVEASQVQEVLLPQLDVDISYAGRLGVRPAGDYPTLIGSSGPSSDRVVFPLIEGAGESTAVIRVEGPSSGVGLICLAPPIVDSDPGVAEVGRTLSFSSEYDCASGPREINAGEIVEIPVTASSDKQFSGIARGKFVVQLQPADGGKVFPESIEFEVPSTLVRSSSAAFITFVVMTVLGLAIPYAGLLFFARRQATFSEELSGGRYASLPIRLGPEGLVSIGDKPVSDYSFIYMKEGSVQRTVETASVKHEVHPPKAWPFAPIRCEAGGPAGSLVVSNLSGDLSGMSSSAPSSQALPDVFLAHFARPDSSGVAREEGASDWASAVSASAPSFQGDVDETLSGELIVILPPSSDPIQAAERALAKVRVWPRWAEVFSAVNGSARPALSVGPGPVTQEQPSPKPNDPLSDW